MPAARAPGNSPIAQLVRAGFGAFTGALHGALYLSAALVAAAALLSAVTLRGRRTPETETP